MNRDNKGFSLVELLIVIAVMAILAGVGLQGFGLVANGNMKKTAGLLNEELRTVQKNSKKIYADYYIDDKNMTIAQVESTMNQIKEIMEEIKE